MLTFHFKPLKYWRVDIRSHIFAAHRLQITSKKMQKYVLKKLSRMLFKVILNGDKWKVEVEMSGSKIIKREPKWEWRWVCNWVRWNGNIINENSLHLILIKEAKASESEWVSEWVKMWTMIWIWCGWILFLAVELHYNMYVYTATNLLKRINFSANGTQREKNRKRKRRRRRTKTR